MNKIRCKVCVGSGSILGGGMMLQDCYNCDGMGKIIVEDENDKVMRKNSDEYNNAKEKIKSLAENISDKEAEKLLDEELEKQGNVTTKRRKKWERKTYSRQANNLYEGNG